MTCARRTIACAAAALLAHSSAFAGSHLWEFSELFSTPDGNVQFIELHVPVDADQEIFLAGKKIKSLATGKVFTFPANIQAPTGFKYLLLATRDFAALPGAPAPDYFIPNNFFGLNGDTLTYHIYDTWVIEAGQLPTDCVNSLVRNSDPAMNTPTNYDDVEGSVVGCDLCPSDLNDSGVVGPEDLAVLLGAWGSADDEADLDDDGVVGAADLSLLLGAWGGC